MTESLQESLDAFAQALLAKAKMSDSLPEMIKAFETVGRYAEQKAKSAPSLPPPAEPQKEPKFAKLQQQFHGASAGRGRTRKSSGEDEAAGNA